MKMKRKTIETKKRHKRKALLVKWLIKNPKQAARNKYKQDALLMACVRNPNMTGYVYG